MKIIVDRLYFLLHKEIQFVRRFLMGEISNPSHTFFIPKGEIMILLFKQKKEAEKQFKKNSDTMDNTTILHAADMGQAKFTTMDESPPNSLSKLWQEIKVMISLLRDYMAGNYKTIPFTTIAAIAGAIIYFVSPLDVIPDFIPGLGYLDDAAVIGLALSLVHDDLVKYKAWMKKND